MNYTETKEALDKFAKYVIQQARTNLTKKKKNLSNNLYKSLKYDLTEKEDGLYLTIYMDEYGDFIDQGVKGANPSLVKNGKQKAPNSPFRYKNKKPPQKFIEQWAKARNFRLRDAKGRFKKGNYRSIGFVLQKFIFAQGIKPSFFFTKPFKQAFKRLPEGLAEAFTQDIINITLETE
jgi:hypothetical protein